MLKWYKDPAASHFWRINATEWVILAPLSDLTCEKLTGTVRVGSSCRERLPVYSLLCHTFSPAFVPPACRSFLCSDSFPETPPLTFCYCSSFTGTSPIFLLTISLIAPCINKAWRGLGSINAQIISFAGGRTVSVDIDLMVCCIEWVREGLLRWWQVACLMDHSPSSILLPLSGGLLWSIF